MKVEMDIQVLSFQNLDLWRCRQRVVDGSWLGGGWCGGLWRRPCFQIWWVGRCMDRWIDGWMYGCICLIVIRSNFLTIRTRFDKLEDDRFGWETEEFGMLRVRE